MAHRLSRDTVALIGDLVPLFDFISILLAAGLATVIYANWVLTGTELSGIWNEGARAALAAAVISPLILCDRAYVSFASGGRTAAVLRCYLVRFAMFIGVVMAIGLASHSLSSLPHAWLALWLVSSLLVTSASRVLLISQLRRLERSGVLAETVAVVGAGPVADRLIQYLQQTRGNRVSVIGVYDDRCARGAASEQPATGSIADLVELGKTGSMDWILLTLPGTAEIRVQAVVHRLKALAAPIGLCPQGVGLIGAPQGPWFSSQDGLPFDMLVDRPRTRSEAIVAAIETVLPHWVVILLGLPLIALQSIGIGLRRLQPGIIPVTVPVSRLECPIDNYDLQAFTDVATHFGQDRYGYVVTPNADHLIRLHREPSFRKLYADAAFILLDSRFISKLLQLTQKLRLPVCTGSDLTATLFDKVIAPDDRLILIGGSAEQARFLGDHHQLRQLSHLNPAMGFIRDPAAVEECLRFIESHSPFRYCLLAIGSPQQEVVAQQLKLRGEARGLVLCIGASINFLTGDEQRAPLWMQRAALEWLFRLMQAPGRMAGRYLVRGPQIFRLLGRTRMVLRGAETAPSVPQSAPAGAQLL